MSGKRLFPIHARESNPESQAILNANRVKFCKQAKQVFRLLMEGYRMTTLSALADYQIGDARTRMSDLRKAGIHFSTVLNENRFKTYYMKKEDMEANKELAEKYL